jgi:hypothetical protein
VQHRNRNRWHVPARPLCVQLVEGGTGVGHAARRGVHASLEADEQRMIALRGAGAIEHLEIKPSPGGGLPPEFKGLITFDEGGGCVETVILPPVTTAHGAWLRTGCREFTFTIVHHLVDPAGNFIGTVKATSHATLIDEDHFQAVFDGTLFDPAGNAVAPISGTERGARILAEAP